jgi:hypothetical protein
MEYAKQNIGSAQAYAQAGGYIGGAVLGGATTSYDRSPPPSPISAMQEASESMDRAISEAMSLAEMLADRLCVVLRPGVNGVGPNGDNKIGPACCPLVETSNRQRSRVQAIGAQLQDLLNRAEV